MKRSTLYFIVFSTIASALNYAIYPVLARILSTSGFVQITVSLALLTQMSSFTLSLVALTIGLSKNTEENPKILIEKLQTMLIHIFIVILLIFLLFSPILLSKLHIPLKMLLPICIMLALSIPMSIITGYLNGLGRLTKLGLVILMSAVFQFILTAVVGSVTSNGTAALNAMALGSFLAIITTYVLYKSENLPHLNSFFRHGLSIYRSKNIRSLVKYTALASLATLVVNILLIFDLLVINYLHPNSKLYADIYVISRIVFFSGMLFVWPFLSNVDTNNPRKNIRLFYKLSGVFIAISLVAMVAMTLFSQQVTHYLLGSNYESTNELKTLAILAVIYKFLYLMITALILYFIVLRSYWAAWLAAILIVATLVALFITDRASNMSIVASLNVAATVSLAFGMCGFFLVSNRDEVVDG